jgi:hypothetical protein
VLCLTFPHFYINYKLCCFSIQLRIFCLDAKTFADVPTFECMLSFYNLINCLLILLTMPPYFVYNFALTNVFQDNYIDINQKLVNDTHTDTSLIIAISFPKLNIAKHIYFRQTRNKLGSWNPRNIYKNKINKESYRWCPTSIRNAAYRLYRVYPFKLVGILYKYMQFVKKYILIDIKCRNGKNNSKLLLNPIWGMASPRAFLFLFVSRSALCYNRQVFHLFNSHHFKEIIFIYKLCPFRTWI